MLNQKKFIQGLAILKANYLKWDFNVDNDFQVNIWYNRFAHLSEEMFRNLVERFVSSSKYPPQSPNDLLDYSETTRTGAEAWEWIVNLNSAYPLCDEYHRPRFFQELVKDSLACKLFKELDIETYIKAKNESQNNKTHYIEVGNVTYGYFENYKKDKFIQWYDETLKNKAEDKIQIETNEKEVLLIEESIY